MQGLYRLHLHHESGLLMANAVYFGPSSGPFDLDDMQVQADKASAFRIIAWVVLMAVHSPRRREIVDGARGRGPWCVT